MAFWFYLLTSYIFSLAGLASAQTVMLTSSVEQDGRQAACTGEVVTFTCMVTEGGALQWTAEPYIRQIDLVTFSGVNNKGETRNPTTQIHIVLDDVRPASDPRLRNFISILTVSDPIALNGTVIQCVSGSRIGMRTLIIGNPPQNPKTTFRLEYSLSNFTVTVQWETPISDGGVGIDNYTLTGAGITVPLTVLSNEPLMTTLTLSYNEMHMVSITASNCAGESPASVVTIHEVGCGPPTPPPHGSLGDLTSSPEGTVVTFQCNPGLVPPQQMVSVCSSEGNWIPDTAELTCTLALPPLGDCGVPASPINGTVNYTTTTEGSQATFQCSAGLVPVEVMNATCEASGGINHWNPDPGGLNCSRLEPESFPGQVIMLHSACTGCTSTGLSTAKAVGIAIVLSFIVSFTAGLLVALVIAYCYIWRIYQKPRIPQQPVHVYEDVTLEISRDIELKDNVAYRVISQQSRMHS